MEIAGCKSTAQVRPANKEFDWNSIRDSVFEEYLGKDPFGFGENPRKGSISGDSCQFLDFSGSSEQSAQTATEPGESHLVHAYQPKAKTPADFWHEKLRAVEQNATDHERRQKLRVTKSHPDFLSLGGYPSPPALPASPTGQSYSAPRRQFRRTGNAANGSKTPTQQRSISNLRAVSRGRPVGVTKPPVSVTGVNPNSTIRQRNGSPSKMMTPSRYRAGFKDVWADCALQSPKKFELKLDNDPLTFPASPPHSTRSTHGAFASFESPTYSAIPGCDERISLNHTARIHTPETSPLLSPGSHAVLSYFEATSAMPCTPYTTTQTFSPNDTAILYPESGSSLAENNIQGFDFDFDGSPGLNEPWSTTSASFNDPSSAIHTTAPMIDPSGTFSSLENDLETRLRFHDKSYNQALGLGISCDANGNYTTVPGNVLQYSSMPPVAHPYYVPSLPNGSPSLSSRPPDDLPCQLYQPHGDPRTPRHQCDPQDRSLSPHMPATESRSRQSSGSRRRLRHRRTKSASATAGHDDKNGAFVNFTPGDAGKILSAVAPSGSSKTKARREKEAADKSLKLSQAAMQAVIEAGGDVESLQRAGLIT